MDCIHYVDDDSAISDCITNLVALFPPHDPDPIGLNSKLVIHDALVTKTPIHSLRNEASPYSFPLSFPKYSLSAFANKAPRVSSPLPCFPLPLSPSPISLAMGGRPREICCNPPRPCERKNCVSALGVNIGRPGRSGLVSSGMLGGETCGFEAVGGGGGGGEGEEMDGCC